MTKEQYQENMSFIKREIEKSKQLLKDRELEYIEANKKTNIGDRIKHIKDNIFGYVIGHEVRYDGSIKEIARKEKKDGTEGLHSMYIWSGDDIELAPK